MSEHAQIPKICPCAEHILTIVVDKNVAKIIADYTHQVSIKAYELLRCSCFGITFSGEIYIFMPGKYVKPDTFLSIRVVFTKTPDLEIWICRPKYTESSHYIIKLNANWYSELFGILSRKRRMSFRGRNQKKQDVNDNELNLLCDTILKEIARLYGSIDSKMLNCPHETRDSSANLRAISSKPQNKPLGGHVTP